MASVAGDDIDILAKAKRALDPGYTPSDSEEYMSPQQLNYFRVLLLEWKKSILSAAEGTLPQEPAPDPFEFQPLMRR